MKTFSISSMTGYGRAELSQQGRQYIVELRSINHRFLEVAVRYPHGWMAVEDPIRKIVKKHVRRGRVDIHISMMAEPSDEKKLYLDWALLKSLMDYQQEMQTKIGLRGELTLSDVLKWPKLWRVEEGREERLDSHLEAILPTVEIACQAIQQMRRDEGEQLASDLVQYCKRLEIDVMIMRKEAPTVVKQQKKRLESRLQEWLVGNEVAKDHIAAEVAILADKTDIAEEITRLNSHIEQFQRALHMKEPVGRRLDFIIQEMNREMNTIGSKVGSELISHKVVESKSVLEKMREQVQNIE